MSDTIYFYRVTDSYGEFSNFADYPITIDGVTWPTSEHYFQAMKFESQDDQFEIRNSATPMDAANKGRDRKRKLRADWETAKDDVMRRGVYEKFTQYPNLTELLLSTGSARIVEHTRNDSYWGDGGHGNGRNMLGQILEETRNLVGT